MVKLHEFLNGTPSQHFSCIRQSKAAKSKSNVEKLKVGKQVSTCENVCDGFFESISKLKSLDAQSIEGSPTFSKYCEDFGNILNICATSEIIPATALKDAFRIEDNLRPEVNNYYSINPKYYN